MTTPHPLPAPTVRRLCRRHRPDRLAVLLGGLLPVLGDRRKQEQALACVTAAAGCDPSFAAALLDVAAVMPAVNPADPSAAAIEDLTAVGQGGLSVPSS